MLKIVPRDPNPPMQRGLAGRDRARAGRPTNAALVGRALPDIILKTAGRTRPTKAMTPARHCDEGEADGVPPEK
jgi:hypothetical protein